MPAFGDEAGRWGAGRRGRPRTGREGRRRAIWTSPLKGLPDRRAGSRLARRSRVSGQAPSSRETCGPSWPDHRRRSADWVYLQPGLDARRCGVRGLERGQGLLGVVAQLDEWSHLLAPRGRLSASRATVFGQYRPARSGGGHRAGWAGKGGRLAPDRARLVPGGRPGDVGRVPAGGGEGDEGGRQRRRGATRDAVGRAGRTVRSGPGGSGSGQTRATWHNVRSYFPETI